MEANTCIDATSTPLAEKKTPCNGTASAPKIRRPLADVSNESPLTRACFTSELFLQPKATVLQPCQLNTFILPSTPATAEPKSQDAAAVDDGDQEEEDDDDEEDAASSWSVAVNVSTPIDRSSDDTDEEEDGDGEEVEDESPDPEEEGDAEDELCRGLGSISLAVANTHAGKHIRFCYESDDEGVPRVEVVRDPEAAPPTPRLRLNGLPTPTGKHSRFEDSSAPGTPVTNH